MKRILCFIISFICLFISFESMAKGVELKYQNKIIHPLCFSKFLSLEKITTSRVERNIESLGRFYAPTEEYKEVSLDECTSSEPYKVEEEGTVRFQSSQKDWERRIDYTPLLEISPNTFLISVLDSGGGSGIFSFLFIFKIEKDKLTLLGEGSESGGDRCNGGISVKSKSKDSILISKNLTPLAFISELSSRDKSLNSKLQDKLLDSAASCFAQKKTVLKLKKQKLVTTEVIIGDFNFENVNITESSLQKCFNLKLKSFLSRKLVNMQNAESKKQTLDYFKENCLKD